MNDEFVLRKMNQLTGAAKAHNTEIVYRELPLKWELLDGILYLDGVWVVPAAFIDLKRMDDAIANAALDTISVPVTDGTLDIMIFGDQNDFGIQCIDRHISHTWRCNRK